MGIIIYYPDRITDQILDLIEKELPEKEDNENVSEYYSGYNRCINLMKSKLREGRG